MTVTVAGSFTTELVSTSSQKLSVSAGASWTTWGTWSSGRFKNNNDKNEFMFVSSNSRLNDCWFQGMTGPPGVAGPQGPPGHNVCPQLGLPSSHCLQRLILDIIFHILFSFFPRFIHFTRCYSLVFAMQGLPGRPGEKGSQGEPVSPSLLLYC